MSGNVGPKIKLDTDVATFVSRTGIVKTYQIYSVNQLVLDLKGAYNGTNYWQYIVYCFPFVGGNANAHKWSLKNNWLLDYSTTLSYTHTDLGMSGSAYVIDTNSTALTSNAIAGGVANFSYYMYVRENTSDAKYLIGNFVPAGQEMGIRNRSNSDNVVLWTANNVMTVTGITDQRGLFQYSKNFSGQLKFYLNGSLLQTGTGDSSLLAGAWNQRGWVLNGEVGGASSAGYQGPDNITANSSTNTISFGMAMNSSAGSDVLSDTDQAAIYAIIQKYQTTLKRQL